MLRNLNRLPGSEMSLLSLDTFLFPKCAALNESCLLLADFIVIYNNLSNVGNIIR